VLEEDGLTMNVVKLMTEDNGLLNAGCGAVFTKEDVQEIDAAIMN